MLCRAKGHTRIDRPENQWGVKENHDCVCKIRFTHFANIDLVTCWRHQMEAFSALLALCVGTSPVTSEIHSQRPVMRALMFSLICAWINSWVNNQDAGDLRRHRSHNDVTWMTFCLHRFSYKWGPYILLLIIYLLDYLDWNILAFGTWSVKVQI